MKIDHRVGINFDRRDAREMLKKARAYGLSPSSFIRYCLSTYNFEDVVTFKDVKHLVSTNDKKSYVVRLSSVDNNVLGNLDEFAENLGVTIQSAISIIVIKSIDRINKTKVD